MPVDELLRTFGVDWPHLLAQMISFSIVCAVLYAFAYTPVLQMLETRRQQIAQGLANADKIKSELKAIAAERQDVLSAAHAEAARIVSDARGAARLATEQEALHARVLGQQILLRARDTGDQERRRMMADVRREAAHLVVETTAAVAGKVLTDADQQRLTSEATDWLAA